MIKGIKDFWNWIKHGTRTVLKVNGRVVFDGYWKDFKKLNKKGGKDAQKDKRPN